MAKTRNSGRAAKRAAIHKINGTVAKPSAPNNTNVVAKQKVKVKKLKKCPKTYKKLVLEALESLPPGKKGSSVIAIKKKILTEYDEKEYDIKTELIPKAIKVLLCTGDIKTVKNHKNSYILKRQSINTFNINARNVPRGPGGRRGAATARPSTGGRAPIRPPPIFGASAHASNFGSSSSIFGSNWGVPPKDLDLLPDAAPATTTSVTNCNASSTSTSAAAPAPAPTPTAPVTNDLMILPDTGSIHYDGCTPYDIHLNLTDHARNMDKFIKAQIIKNNNGDFYFVNAWGKNGTPGAQQQKGPISETEAIKLFEKKFKDKTGKSWSQRDAAGSGTANSNARGGQGHYEMKQRLQAAGAGQSKVKGSIAISLMWDHSSPEKRNDLDLWVRCPSGEHIGYSHKQSRCNGFLDVDRMQDALQPVENIVWKKNTPKGEYVVFVHNYSSNHKNVMPFHVSFVIDGGAMEMVDLDMPGVSKKWIKVRTFEYK